MRRPGVQLAVALTVALTGTACADAGFVDDDPTEAGTATGAPQEQATPSEAASTEPTESPDDDGTATPSDDEAAATDGHDADDAEVSAQAAVDAVTGADITGSTKPSAAEDGDDIVFGPCLGPDDFDLDTLDDVTASSFDADVQGANGQEGSLEVRAFDDAATAAEAYSALQVVLGTPEGRECFASQVAASLGGGAAPEIAAYTAGGVELGIRLTANFGGQEFFIDYLAAQSGGCTFLGSFQGRGEPFDAEVAGAMFAAALP